MDYLFYALFVFFILYVFSWLKTKPFSRAKNINRLKDDFEFKYIAKKFSKLNWGSKVILNKTELQCCISNCQQPIYLQNLDASILIELSKELCDRDIKIYCLDHSEEQLLSVKRIYSKPRLLLMEEKATEIHRALFNSRG